MEGMRALGLMLAVFGVATGPGDEVRSGTFTEIVQPGNGVRVLDWNIDRGTRLDAVAATIRKVRPDLCLLQEVDLNTVRSGHRDVARDLARAVQMNYLFGAAFRELGQGGGQALQGQAILTRLEVRSQRVLRFARQTRFWQPQRLVPNWGIMQRRLGGRIALVAELGRGKERLVVYNVHLESRGFGATRLGQLRELLEDARRYGPDVPVIIGGDLNTKYHAGLFESKLAAEGFRSCLGARRVRTHVLYGALDWIFVRAAACEDPEVVRGSKASDHDPIVATVKWPYLK
jgi:endonuclease/exonuclease/phosphatase family metal-dependent hydrolase